MGERKELQLQGPRPSALRITKDSHKINKPPRPQSPHRRPVIIYTVSPKIIHTEPTEFKDLVQRLTGLPPHGPSNDHRVSREMMSMSMSVSVSMSMPMSTHTNSTIEHGVERVGHFPAGILSPMPESLPPISSTIFMPPMQAAAAADLSPFTRFLQDLSPMAPNQFSPSLDNIFQNFPDHFH